MDDVIKSKIYYPMLVSGVGTGEPLSKEEDSLIWKKYLTLSQPNRDILTSYELPRKLRELKEVHHLSESVIGKISLFVRKVFFQEMDMVTLTTQISSLVTQSSSDTNKISEVVNFLDQEIFHLVPKTIVDAEEADVAKVAGIKKLPLLKAMAEYPRLGEQVITGEKIKLKNQPEPVRPSLANWIHYYRDELGIGFHDQVTRGKFLFQSENGKRLSADERERVNLIVKSIEEETPVDVDTDRMQVVFPARVPTAPVSAFPKGGASLSPARPVKPFQPLPPVNTPVTPPAKTNPETVKQASSTEPSFFAKTFGPAKNVANDTLEFSTGHVLPGERAAPSPARPDTRGGQAVRQTAAPAPLVAPTPTFNMSSISRNQPQALPRSPYSIRPLRMRGEEKDMDGSE